MSDDAPRASASPPSTPPPPGTQRRQDTLSTVMPPGGPWGDGWRPGDDDFSPKATAWRAWHALQRTERHKGELADFRDALAELKETIDAGLSFLRTLIKLLRWGGAILGGAGLLAGGGALVRWLLTLHH
jgi:hypothetical protein